ncbi:N-methylhydantoinase A/oxoprolinase/acetone carboxylase, beta subunit [Sinosporangium album]|uniref:N-methylhydantoinase A/oxoprolinase/acetone carboxylase, beta subunit n=1 Tax=Sinosporangium album TaxID=504805 RepID=A0A1G7YSY0_9ACTN|nr:hydantoinase/oxoprolinase family protein [Sinosporangium album]SDG99366.1 N-methylhydantoinase A/oxoprolinase/acetone carboxylase, beta subunit [Sinosporangium album]
MPLRIGIDVGGTNTDAVVLDGRRVVIAAKAPTSQDVTSGILTALTGVLHAVDADEVASVFIGTTHFINAIAQGRELGRVAAVRLATPPQSLLPMIDWPDRLRRVVDGGVYVCAGGAQFDGSPLNELDEAGLRGTARQIAASGVRHVALSSIFSTVNPEPEIRAEEILREELPEASITRSTLIGRAGLLERESATILNAALLDLAGRVIDGLEDVVAGAGISAPVLLSQNDGTVMTLDRARRFPIFTIASGPTNSMRGAALLTGIDHGVVVDVGGTTSDVGVIQHGFPRESTVAMSLAGVRSNFRIPDVLSLALGGGTHVAEDGATVGPESVGLDITREARVFGGDTLTFTDIAVAAGAAPIGDPAAVSDVPADTVRRALDIASDRLVRAIDKAKLTSAEIPVIVVGGGGPLLNAVPRLGDVIIPEHADVANAVGAAFAEAGGEIDRVYALEGTTRAAALESAKAEAIARAVDAGADPEAVRITDAEDVPLTHLPGGGAVHIRVKAAGPFRTLVAIPEGH